MKMWVISPTVFKDIIAITIITTILITILKLVTTLKQVTAFHHIWTRKHLHKMHSFSLHYATFLCSDGRFKMELELEPMGLIQAKVRVRHIENDLELSFNFVTDQSFLPDIIEELDAAI